MNDSVMDLSLLNLGFAYIFVLLILLIFKSRGIARERQIVTATIRMSIQLTIMGYVLMYVFEHPSWYLTLLVLGVMVSFAIYNAKKRVKYAMPVKLRWMMAAAMIIGYILTAFVFLLLILQVDPWFNPQYCIPISGMIIGNAMTGIALGANKLCSGMRERKHIIENSLMLGATPKAATHDIVNDAFDSSLLPTMNNMLAMGIVSLPGMMTGQILSGTFPITAIKYQIGIMMAILGCTAISVVIFVSYGYKTFFTKHDTLID